MAKEELIEMKGKVDEMLPDTRYRVTLDNGHTLIAYTGGKMRKHRIRILAGDRRHAGDVAVRPHQRADYFPPHRKPPAPRCASACLQTQALIFRTPCFHLRPNVCRALFLKAPK